MAEQTIDRLVVEVEAKAKGSTDGVDKLAISIQKLKSAIGGGTDKLNSVAESMSKLKAAVAGSGTTSNQISKLSAALQTLKNVQLSGFSNDIQNLKNSMSGLSDLGNGLQSVKDFGKGVTSMVKSMGKIKSADLSGTADKIQEMVKALRPLTDEMLRAGPAAASYGTGMREMAQAMRTANNAGKLTHALTENTKKLNNSFKFLNFGKVVAGFYALKQAGGYIKGFIGNINNYIEDINLFTVAMGDANVEGMKFAKRMQDVLGIDSGQAMRNMGYFQQLTTSFGITSDKSYILSKNLTQLAYDFSSFLNLDVENAFEKIRSGIVGEIEPLRAIGKDLSMARLQQELYTMGIDKNVESLTQADKALLWYNVLMKQSANEMGDLSRTLSSPSNQLRIFNAQLQLAGRAIGSIFIPALNAILPYAIAVTKVIGEAATALAAFFGFEMPKFEMSSIEGVTTGIGGITDGMDDLAGSTAEAKKQTKLLIGGFDELNTLQDKNSAGGAGSAGAGGIGGSILGDMKLPEYDMFGKGINDEIDKIAKSVKGFLDKFKNSAAVKLISKLLGTLWNDIIKPFGKWALKNPDTIANVLAAIGAAILTYKLVKGISAIAKAISGAGGLLKGLSGLSKMTGVAPLFAGLAKIFTNPWAIAIAAVAAAFVLVGLSLYQAWEDAKRTDLEKRFGNIALSMEEVQKVAEALTTNDLSIRINAYFDEKEALSNMYDSLSELSNTITKDTWKISLGVDVDLEDYRANIDSFIQQAQDTLTQQHLVYTMAIDLGFSDANIQSEMRQFVDEYFSQSQGEMERLGKELRKKIDESLADGKLSEEELKVISNLQSEINQIVQKMADAEYKARLTSVLMELKGIDLTPESFVDALKSANDILNDQFEKAKGIKIDSLKLAEFKFAEDGNKQAYNAAIKNIEATFNETKMNLQVQANSFGIDTIYQAYEKELSQDIPKFTDFTSSEISKAFEYSWDYYSDGSKDFNISKFLNGIGSSITKDFETTLTPVMKSNISDLLEEFKPREESLKEMQEYYVSIGGDSAKIMLESISKELSDISTLKALSGDVQGIYETIGYSLSDSPEAIKFFEDLKSKGYDIPQEVMDAMKSQHENLEKEAVKIPEILGSNIQTEIETQAGYIKESARMLETGMLTGVQEQIKEDEKSWKEWALWPWNWFKSENEIESPSKLFIEGGKYISEGALSGAKSQMSNDTDAWNTLFQDPIKWFKETFGIGENSNSTVFDDFGKSLMNGLWDGLKSVWSNVLNWFTNNVKLPEIKNPFTKSGMPGIFDKPKQNPRTTYEAEPNVNWYAKGGAFYERAIIGVGDNPNANSDPEIVAPQSMIAEAVQTANAELAQAMYQMAVMIVEAYQEGQNVSVQLDGREIGKASAKYMREEQKRTGKNPATI